MSKQTKQVRAVVARLDRIIEEYKAETPKRHRDWRTYEQQFALKMRTCFSEIEPMVEDAVSKIKIIKTETRGNEPKLNLKQKVLLLLLKQFCIKSNRAMEGMTTLFLWLTDIDVSYKSIERLYSDTAVQLAMHNLHILILKKKGITTSDACGDGTGHTIRITEHYATEAKKRKDKAKTNNPEEKKIEFTYSFALMDIKTRMYIGYGTSIKSEKEAFEKALTLAKETGITIQTLRLDRYYSAQAYVQTCQEQLGKVTMFLIPKKNIASLGVGEFCSMIYRFVDNTKAYLQEYYKRNQSESGFSEDKKRTGWKITQRREDRIDLAYTLTATWHNLCWLGNEV